MYEKNHCNVKISKEPLRDLPAQVSQQKIVGGAAFSMAAEGCNSFREFDRRFQRW